MKIKKLKLIKANAIKHRETPDVLLHRLQSLSSIKSLKSKFGIISNDEAHHLLRNNILATTRQHDLGDAEYFREQLNSLNNINEYFIETIHGCHIAPTVRPITFGDVINLINATLRNLAK